MVPCGPVIDLDASDSENGIDDDNSDLIYVWRRNGATIEDCTGSSCSILEGGSFELLLTNGQGCTTTTEFTIEGSTATEITISELGKIVENGEVAEHTFSVNPENLDGAIITWELEESILGNIDGSKSELPLSGMGYFYKLHGLFTRYSN